MPDRKAPLEIALVAGEVAVAPGDGDARAGAPAVVAPGEEMDPEDAGPALDLDPIEKADREQRGIHRDAVDARGDVRDAVEVVLGRRGAPALES